MRGARAEAFEGRSSVRAWLYRIATNRCLNALRDRARRPREVQAMVEPPEPTRRTEPIWLEPYRYTRQLRQLSLAPVSVV